MKKRILSLFICYSIFITYTGKVYAQDSPVSLGAKVGLNLTGFSGDLKDTKMLFNYHLGITADVELADDLYIQTGLDLVNKGAKQKSRYTDDVKYRPIYLQLPLHIAYKMDLEQQEDAKLVFGVGPYFAYGIGGKIKAMEKSDFFSDNTFKRFDMGFGANIGLEVNTIVVNVGYDFGLINICQVKNEKVRNQYIYLTLEYKFHLQ